MKPLQNYILCAVQGSGSSLVCEALKNTQLAGIPEEHFGGWEDGEKVRQKRITPRKAHLEQILQKGVTVNGVFGCKIMWNYFGETVAKLRTIPSYADLDDVALMARVFQQPRYVRIIRKDKVCQAISWTIATQTSTSASDQLHSPYQEPRFDFAMINNLYRLIEVGEEGWLNFFEQAHIRPFTVVYEDFAANYDAKIKEILRFLEIDYPDDLFLLPAKHYLQRQSNALIDEWKARYWEIKELQLNDLTHHFIGSML